MKTAKVEGVRVLDESHGEAWSLYNAECVDFASQLPDNSIDFSIYSPPFANVYCYSDSLYDMGNCADDAEFLRQYAFLARELHRILRPGRLVAVHCKDLVKYAGSSEDGMAGLRDFPGDLIRVHQAAGFSFHSRVTVWKCPVTERARTNAHGLLYKQLRKDSSFSRQGCAEYVLLFRKWAKEDQETLVQRVSGAWCERCGDTSQSKNHTHEGLPLETWQQWASPVWMDIDQMDVLNVKLARADGDEKHNCPLQLDLIDRALVLWTNPGDVVFSPFAGVGSEGFGAVKRGRKFLGSELKPEYFEHAKRHLTEAARASGQGTLFAAVAP